MGATIGADWGASAGDLICTVSLLGADLLSNHTLFELKHSFL